MKKSFAERCVPYLFIAGTFLMLIVFMYFSVGLAFYTSLTDKMPGRETHFIGLENYKALLSDDMFRMSFRNQAVLSLFAVFNSVFFPLLAALILYHVRHKKLSRIIKTLFVIPMLVPSIVVILIWKYLYNPNFGFNSILKLLHHIRKHNGDSQHRRLITYRCFFRFCHSFSLPDQLTKLFTHPQR